MFNRTMIETMIKEGKIVPAEVTIKLLQEAMIKSENDKFLIDGFPRNEENRAAFENVVRPSSLFVPSSHDISRDFPPFFYVHLKEFTRILVVSHCYRQKFLQHLCYSLIVPRKRWKNVFWGAIRFPLSLIATAFF
jgi:hypothetical protein